MPFAVSIQQLFDMAPGNPVGFADLVQQILTAILAAIESLGLWVSVLR